jgi:hypothetical protein
VSNAYCTHSTHIPTAVYCTHCTHTNCFHSTHTNCCILHSLYCCVLHSPHQVSIVSARGIADTLTFGRQSPYAEVHLLPAPLNSSRGESGESGGSERSGGGGRSGGGVSAAVEEQEEDQEEAVPVGVSKTTKCIAGGGTNPVWKSKDRSTLSFLLRCSVHSVALWLYSAYSLQLPLLPSKV